MTKGQIKHMVNRFLGRRLPENFYSDGGISFTPLGNVGTKHEYKRDPTGTNLLDATQATAVERHMVGEMPASKDETGWLTIDVAPKLGEILAEVQFRFHKGLLVIHWADSDGYGEQPAFGPGWFYRCGDGYAELTAVPLRWKPIGGSRG